MARALATALQETGGLDIEAPAGLGNALTAGESPSPRDQQRLLLRWSDRLETPNIAEELRDNTGTNSLGSIGFKVIEEADLDNRSREEWIRQSRDAMDLAMLVAKGKTDPWPGCSNIVYPLMAVAAVQFAARAYPAVVADRNVVRGVVFGEDEGVPLVDPRTGQSLADPQTGEPLWAVPPGELRRRADRVASHMSWQLLEEQPEWEPETDKLLHILPIQGCAFRKNYYDPGEGRNFSVLVSPKNLIVNYYAQSLETAPRITEIIEYYPHEIEEMVRAGLFLDQDYGQGKDAQDPDSPHEFYEQHRRLDLDEDGYPEPYIVTVHKETMKVARIVARYEPQGVFFDGPLLRKIEPVHYYTAYEFLPNPDGGVYGLGFGQLLRPINEAVNSTLNMLFDAGHLANAGGGFIGKGLSLHAGAVRFRPGEYKEVRAFGSAIRDAIVPLDFPGPSPVLFQLLGMLIEAGKDVAAIKDILTGETRAANTPATTILALIEQGLKVFTAIFKRVHRSLKKDYDKLYRLNSIYLDDIARFRVGNEMHQVSRLDYQRGAGIAPVSDPKTVSDMQKLGRAEFLKTWAGDPHVDQVELRRRVFEAAQIENVDDLLLTEQPPDPAIELKKIEVKARAVKEMALAYKAIGETDIQVLQGLGPQGLQWVAAQMDLMRLRIETLDQEINEQQQQQQPGSADGSERGQRAALPGMASTSGDVGPAALSQRLGGAVEGGPPVQMGGG